MSVASFPTNLPHSLTIERIPYTLFNTQNQITEYKSAQVPAQAALRTALLDPAVNLLLQKLRAELQSTRGRLEDVSFQWNLD